MAEPGFKKVAETSDLASGEMKLVALGQGEVLLANVDGNFYAINGTCTHMGGRTLGWRTRRGASPVSFARGNIQRGYRRGA
ncbi:MAG TPA: hypothetical protein EYN14_07090 [Alphaproteobacteria bacterium]|nr:hypothetical protein [Alphaproteobacteria bacterium]